MTETVKRLEGWLTFQEAANMLGLTKQGMHQAVFNAARRRFDINDDIRAVGDKPIWVIRESAVLAERDRRSQVG